MQYYTICDLMNSPGSAGSHQETVKAPRAVLVQFYAINSHDWLAGWLVRRLGGWVVGWVVGLLVVWLAV